MKKRKTIQFLFWAKVKGRVGVGEQERTEHGVRMGRWGWR